MKYLDVESILFHDFQCNRFTKRNWLNYGEKCYVRSFFKIDLCKIQSQTKDLLDHAEVWIPVAQQREHWIENSIYKRNLHFFCILILFQFKHSRYCATLSRSLCQTLFLPVDWLTSTYLPLPPTTFTIIIFDIIDRNVIG